jgi:hypothetical protein
MSRVVARRPSCSARMRQGALSCRSPRNRIRRPANIAKLCRSYCGSRNQISGIDSSAQREGRPKCRSPSSSQSVTVQERPIIGVGKRPIVTIASTKWAP